ncbi:GPI ethanolamine phosphate transferase 3 [Parasteatoda tepidariorum]|uniref:GPI ethanolamine phosphate transferase 3 n=1 Tax=Parasteatoda tepidariorum TaxID=114398 RepID=UPI001C71B106|nr:GPI ethanolamine phosphate transferase 3 [Parasteatoda tepidariorum]
MSLKNSLIVLWVYIMYVLGIWFFLSGFLLKRIVIHQHSKLPTNLGVDINCKNLTSLRAVASASEKSMIYNETHLQRFNKTVILVIDALRYDFAFRESGSMHNEFYSDKMPIFKKLLQNEKGHAMIFRTMADPPTTTLQRLAGLTTGSLPTFVDICFNFASSEIKEDNLISQMKAHGKKITFMGDDTWENIFPNHFDVSHPYPSFNVKDLDTVDEGILKHLYKEIESDDSDVIIAHFLGVDHCGHRYGPTHPEMSRKLRQMNKVVELVAKKIKQDAILLVLGDHGMTQSGDHGGDSLQEITTALFLYSPSYLGDFNMNDDVPTIQQVDIVPTLSLLLGIPIPYSNIGSAISQVFTLNFNFTCFHPKLDSLLGKALAGTENILQVQKYVHTYSKVSEEMTNYFLTHLNDKTNEILQVWNNITNDVPESAKILIDISVKCKELLQHIRQTCEEKWATFHLQNMSAGFIVLFFVFYQTLELSEKAYYSFKLLAVYGILAFLMIVIVYLFKTVDYYFIPCVFLFMKCYRVLIKFSTDAEFVSNVKVTSIPAACVVMFFIMSFSNSFVVNEDSAVMYILQSIIIYRFFPLVAEFTRTCVTLFFCRGKTAKKSPKWNWKMCIAPTVLFLLILTIKLGSVFFKCREEQVHCENSILTLSLEKLHDNETFKVMRLVISWISVISPSVIFFTILKYKYSNFKRPQTVSAIAMNYGSCFVCIVLCLRWWLNILPSSVVDRVLKGNEVFLDRSAFLISLIMCVLTTLYPFLCEQPWQLKSKEIYHCSFLSLLLCIVQLLQLVAGDALSSAITLMSLSTLFYIILVNASPDSENWIWTDTIICFFLSRFWFYASAQQSTITTISWEPAFLFTHKEIYSYILSGALVTVNTFSSYIFHGLMLPLLLTCTESSIFTSASLLRLHMRYIFLFGFKLIGTVWAAFILRRHLMVWKIFSPKLIFEVITLFISMISVAIGHLFLKKVASHYHRLIRLNLSHVFESKDQ